MRYDVLILGGGAAGCVLAARLSEDPGRSVCLVEAGPDYGPYAGGRWPADLVDGRTVAFSHAWERLDEEDRSQLRARVLGGCSAHNACILLRGLPSDYDAWGHGWSHAAIEPCFERAERELRRREFADEELAPWQRAFMEAARTIGLQGGPHGVNQVGTVRWHTAFAYLDPARGRPNLTILADTLADRVLLRDGRAVGAETSAGLVEAESTILCSGAYGSPAILLRSGIGPGGTVDLPVGEGLRDHVGVGYSWEVEERLTRETADFEREQALFMGQVTLWHGDCELYVFPANDPVEEGPGYAFSGAVFAMNPASTGRVTLSAQDPEAPPRVEHGFLADERDRDSLVRGLQLVRTVAATEPVAGYLRAEERPGADADLEAYVRAEARGFFHPVGTCAIGSVVDGEGRVLGVEALRVVDASIMPALPRAPTHLSTVAVAERIAGSFA
jgi:choline dehydrogenase-like flavoprotein